MKDQILLYIFILITIGCIPTEKEQFQAHYANVAPIIDGQQNDSIWADIPGWYSDYYIWINNVGSSPTASDFSWRYKLAWNEDEFYVLAEITDEQLKDIYQSPNLKYWEDDCFEVLFDEDNSGGDHQNSFQAFIYHISTSYDAVDIDDQGNVVLLNDHLKVKMDTINGKYMWEAAFKVYDESYNGANYSNPVKLHEGKVMGWSMAYCDNDGKQQRDHFFGTNEIIGKDKNITWKTADAFGEVKLVK